MKILHICTSSEGGAAIAAIRLHYALLEYGYDSRILFLNGGKEVNHGYYWRKYPGGIKHRSSVMDLVARVFQKFGGRSKNLSKQVMIKSLEIFTSPITKYLVEEHPLVLEADIIQLHWIANFVNFETFFAKVRKPIFWYFHDMNPMLGGLHYDLERSKLKVSGLDQMEANYDRIKDMAVSMVENLYVQCDSFWLTQLAERSPRFKKAKSISTIHYSLDFDLFAPVDKTSARQALRIPANASVILFGADDVSNERKGFGLLICALSQMAGSLNIILCTFGRAKDLGTSLNTKFEVRNYGEIESPVILSLIYSSADVFVIPSRQEAFGQTALESLACGTPVIGYRTGGIPDSVTDGQNGLLADAIDAASLMACIENALNNKSFRDALARNSRASVIDRFSKSRQVDSFIKLYDEALNDAKAQKDVS